MGEVTRILAELEANPSRSTDALLPIVYQELREMAAAKLVHERPGQTLDATSLVHEAFLKLVGNSAGWESRRHFFGAAAEAMRRILIDRARARRAKKRGGELHRADVDLEQVPVTEDQRLLLLDEAIERLSATDRGKAELVKLRYFAGLTIKEAAELLEISTATADRHWAYARAWLQNAIDEGHH